MPELFSVTFCQRDWMKACFPASDRGGVSNDVLFNQLRNLLVGNGMDMKDVVMSPSLIRDMQGKEQLKIADGIKVIILRK